MRQRTHKIRGPLVCLVLLSGFAFSGVAYSQVHLDNIPIVNGPYDTGSVVAAAIGNVALLCMTLQGFDDPTQILTYMWYQSDDNGQTYHPWNGGKVKGGPTTDTDGNPVLSTAPRCSTSPPRTHGSQRVKVVGSLISPTTVIMSISVGDKQ